MIRRPPRSTLASSSAASDVYKRQGDDDAVAGPLQQKFYGGLDSAVVIHDEDFCQSRLSVSIISNQCLVVNPLPVPRKHFFGSLSAMLLKRTASQNPYMHDVGQTDVW